MGGTARTGLVILLAGLVAACGTALRSDPLTMAQMQTLNPGVSAAWVQSEFPQGRVTRTWPGGCPREMSFRVRDACGSSQRLVLGFDRSGIATSKQYSGRMVRPPGNHK